MKSIICTTAETSRRTKIKINAEIVEQVEEFTYLESIITENGKRERETGLLSKETVTMLGKYELRSKEEILEET